MYGLGTDALREMLAELIEEGLVNSNASAMAEDHSRDMTRNIASDERLTDLNRLRLGKPVVLRLAHKGRRQLFRLQDELLDDHREAWGIIFSRRAWDRALAVRVLFASPDSPLALLFADIDHFKKVNDTYGHTSADEMLKRVFTIMRDLTDDRAYRFGGEEVSALFPDTSLDEATEVAERIRSAIKNEAFKGASDQVMRATISVGVAGFIQPVEATHAQDFVDRVMYEAKHGGRDRVVAKPG
jgi:diguanylate cyclase (GGDEF)-like protein